MLLKGSLRVEFRSLDVAEGRPVLNHLILRVLGDVSQISLLASSHLVLFMAIVDALVERLLD